MRRACEVADPGTPPVYGTGWTNHSWADRFKTEVKSSQVKLLISIGTNKCAKQRAQHNKTKNAACDALMKLQI